MYLTVTARWKSLLNWMRLADHGGVGRVYALPILVAGLLLLSAFVLALPTLMVYLMPENVNMLIDTVAAYLSSREI